MLTLLPVSFVYFLSSEAVVMKQLRRWKRHWRKSLTCSHKRTSMGPYRCCWNGTSALQPEEITSKGTRISCVYYQWKCPYEKSLETYLMILVHMGKLDSALNNQQKLSCHKIKPSWQYLIDYHSFVKKSIVIVGASFYSSLNKIFTDQGDQAENIVFISETCFYLKVWLYQLWGGVVANVVDYDILISEFKIESRNCVPYCSFIKMALALNKSGILNCLLTRKMHSISIYKQNTIDCSLTRYLLSFA